MGSAAGKKKQKEVYVVGKKNVQDEKQVKDDTSIGMNFAGENFQDMVKQAAAISSSSDSKPTQVEAVSSSRPPTPEAMDLIPQVLPDDLHRDTANTRHTPAPVVKQIQAPKSIEAEFSSDSESDSNIAHTVVDISAKSSVSTATSQQQEAALKAVRDSKMENMERDVGFGEALQQNYRQLAGEREEWFKSIGLQETPIVVRAATRVKSSSPINRAGVDGASVSPSLRDPDIMEEVCQWNAKRKDETHPALTAAMA